MSQVTSLLGPASLALVGYLWPQVVLGRVPFVLGPTEQFARQLGEFRATSARNPLDVDGQFSRRWVDSEPDLAHS